MSRNLFIAIIVCMPTLFLSSCGHEQQLVSITIQPTVENFGSTTTPVSANAGASVQLKALGTYVHPPATKDITGQATWSSNTPQMVTVNSTGLLTATGEACGSALIWATVTTNNSAPSNISSSGAVVTGNMTANVICPESSTAALTVNLGGTGSGLVTSSPAGINCPTTCMASFATGTAILLTATPGSGSSFGGWSSGCSPTSSPICTISDLISNLDITATFN
jgi:hypothetical protein